MRIIESHKTNDCNEAITIEADERDPDNGNTSHVYHLSWPMEDYHLSWPMEEGGEGTDGVTVEFQHGPIQEVGVNGVTNEALLALLIDRIEGFQSGEFACNENGDALHGLKHAMQALLRRTQKRVARGVEGTHEV